MCSYKNRKTNYSLKYPLQLIQRIYLCRLCDAKFQVREQLRKHMYSHTGSKPYKCSFCSRQFFYESVLKSHEK